METDIFTLEQGLLEVIEEHPGVSRSRLVDVFAPFSATNKERVKAALVSLANQDKIAVSPGPDPTYIVKRRQ